MSSRNGCRAQRPVYLPRRASINLIYIQCSKRRANEIHQYRQTPWDSWPLDKLAPRSSKEPRPAFVPAPCTDLQLCLPKRNLSSNPPARGPLFAVQIVRGTTKKQSLHHQVHQFHPDHSQNPSVHACFLLRRICIAASSSIYELIVHQVSTGSSIYQSIIYLG